MSSPPPVPDTVAIAFLVEASLSVAQQWRVKISEYSSHLLKRLGETHPGAKVRVAFVTYGFADTLPSPILCKRFFTDFLTVSKEMEDLSRLGIGMTTDGGSRGMAALEGFVAVLELFDILHSHSQPPTTEGSKVKPPISHIVHVANSSPDASTRPLWNDSSSLDKVTWDSLPTEITKRNIQLSSLNLRPNLSRFPELHAAVVTGGSSPWFTVRPPHTVFLAPFPSPPTKVSPSKRSVEADRPSEAKRPRIQATTESPKPSPKSSAPPAQTNIAVLPVTQPIRPTPTAPQLPAHVEPPVVNRNLDVMNRVRLAHANLKDLEARITKANAEGQAALAATLMQEYTVKKTQQIKVTQALNQQLFAARQAMEAQNGLSQTQGVAFPQRDLAAPPFGLNNGMSSLSTGNLPSSSNASASLDVSQMQHSRSLSETTFPTGASPANTLAATAPAPSQMQQKSAEQQLPRPTMTTNVQPAAAIPLQNMPPRPDPSRNPAAPALTQGPAQAEQPANARKNVKVWSGSLIWSGQGTGGTSKEVRAQVIAFSTNPLLCRADTWPPNLTLAPGGPQVPLHGLQEWMKRHQPAICTFKVPPEFKAHESYYSSFVQLLTMKNIYATASWTTPKGGPSKNALIFPVGTGLAGAFFPLTGLPELPKPAPSTVPPINLPMNIVAQMQNFNNLSPQQRELVMAQLHQFRQNQNLARQQQQQQQQQQRLSQGQDVHNIPPLFPTNAPNHGNVNTVLNMMNNQANQASGALAMNASQTPFHNMAPRLNPSNLAGGVQGNVSYEMLQSFVQRNSDAGNNLNP